VLTFKIVNAILRYVDGIGRRIHQQLQFSAVQQCEVVVRIFFKLQHVAAVIAFLKAEQKREIGLGYHFVRAAAVHQLPKHGSAEIFPARAALVADGRAVQKVLIRGTAFSDALFQFAHATSVSGVCSFEIKLWWVVDFAVRV
jgi:hypothetical protein